MSEFLPLSIVVAVRNAQATLAKVLGSIRASALSPTFYELIVVDDGSTDGSPLVAARYADTVVKLTGARTGPAYARNRGFEVARGRVVAFIDDDVTVKADTLEQMLATLESHPDVDAVSATRDELAQPTDFVSRYWNALVRFGEEWHAGNRAHFVSGCGMIRRHAFAAAGMYDEWRFHGASLETAELGQRMCEAGRGVLLSSGIKVAHIRQWSFASLYNEVWLRGRTLARSLGYSRMRAAVPSEVVFTLTRTLIPAMALAATLSLAAAFVPSTHTVSKAALVLGVLLISNLSIHRYYARTFGLGFAILAAPLHVLAQIVVGFGLCVGWLLREILGDPAPDAVTQAYAEVGVELWPPVRRRV